METKLHGVVPEDLYKIAQVIDTLRQRYGPKKAAYILRTVAKALETGKYPPTPPAGFVMKGI
jgi:hypothetical protein